MVNVLHITSFDKGGAGNSVLRIHTKLLKKRINSKVLVKKKFSSEKNVIKFKPTKFELIKYYWCQFNKKLSLKLKNANPDYFSDYKIGFDITKSKEFKDADIIHLHWISEFVNYKKFFENLGTKKLIWTVRDANPFTGGCHIPTGCNKYQQKCGNCPKLLTCSEKDISRKGWEYKKENYSNISKIISLSSWEKEFLIKSSLFNKKGINIISPGMPSNFLQYNKFESRKYFNLPQKKFLILFGSFAETKSKGFIYLKKASKLLKEFGSRIEFVSFGSDFLDKFELKINSVGNINSIEKLSKLYSAVDVLVMPSEFETFGKVFAEAMACGTPTICFDIGGPKDVIENGKDGFLLEVGDYKGIAKKIVYLKNNPKKRMEMGKRARKKIIKKHTLEKEINKYIELYKKVLGENK